MRTLALLAAVGALACGGGRTSPAPAPRVQLAAADVPPVALGGACAVPTLREGGVRPEAGPATASHPAAADAGCADSAAPEGAPGPVRASLRSR